MKLVEVLDLEAPEIQKQVIIHQPEQEEIKDEQKEESSMIDTKKKTKGRGNKSKGGEQQQIQKVKKTPLKYMWTLLGENQKARTRAAALQFTAAFVQNMPADLVRAHLPALVPIVFNLVDEPNSLLETTLWKEAIYTIANKFPDDCWKAIAIKKTFLPKLNTCL